MREIIPLEEFGAEALLGTFMGQKPQELAGPGLTTETVLEEFVFQTELVQGYPKRLSYQPLPDFSLLYTQIIHYH